MTQNPVEFRDPARAKSLALGLGKLMDRAGRKVTLMHVCGSHEQAIARYGLRSTFPRDLDVVMGPGCPVCITDVPEVDEAVALALSGVRVATYGDMLRVPGTARSLADARAEGAKIDVVYGVSEAVRLARSIKEDLVFFATGFETTAVATAAELAAGPPRNFSVLSAHKYIPPAMEIVAGIPGSQIEGFLAAGHAAAITGWGIFEPFAARHKLPVVVAGFEPLDILAALVRLVELAVTKNPAVENMYPRCVTKEGNLPAQETLWKVFEPLGGVWRGVAHVPDGNLRLRESFADFDARKRFKIDLSRLWDVPPPALVQDCICGAIMTGTATPAACKMFGKQCTPDAPIGACMVSSEGSCRIWHQYGGIPDLRSAS